ncbi:MAG: response regulator [Candidatus Omnitrophota bacterium]
METQNMPDKDENLGKKRILLIDDDKEICFFTKKYLENKKELKVIVENSGEAGLKIAQEKKPDLILLDIMMTGMDGLTVLTRLKGSEETRSIPVIMLTAKGDIGSIAEAQILSVADYLIKPFEPEQLLRLISKCIKSERKTKLNNK